MPLSVLFEISPLMYKCLELEEMPFSRVLIAREPYYPQLVSEAANDAAA